MNAKSALIIGIAGQDGSYLAELLLEKGYMVSGMVRGPVEHRFERIEHIRERIDLLQADLLDQSSLEYVMRSCRPDEVYNLAAPSFVPASWLQPVSASDLIGLGTTRVLEAIRATSSAVRYYQASSSEIFGTPLKSPQDEDTPFRPRSPYGAAKAYAHNIVSCYRSQYEMFCVSGVLYNHESPRRGLEFVSRKVTDAAAQIKVGKLSKLKLGRLDAVRDWGFAGDYVRAMWMMLQQDTPRDYVIASGIPHTVQDLVEVAFDSMGLDWRKYVEIDPKYVRPPEAHLLLGNPSRAHQELGWRPEVSFEQLVMMMANADLEMHQAKGGA